jgi:inner membrane protein
VDNLTHSLIGLCIGKSAKASSKSDRHQNVIAAVIASNIPDVDILYYWISGAPPIGYLMQHRGYTHTVIIGAFLAILSSYLSAALCSKPIRWNMRIVLICLAGVYLHLLFDFFNSYGVHPFWPFHNGWIYGDSLFIIEPLIWFSLLAYALWSSERLWSRAVWTALSVACFSIFWILAPLGLSMKILLSFLFLLLNLFQSWHRGSLTMAWSSLAGVVLLFTGASWVAEIKMRDYIQNEFSSETLIQLSQTPFPANPFCWTNIMVSQSEPNLYVARRGTQSLLEPWISCDQSFRAVQQESLKSFSSAPLGRMGPHSVMNWEVEYINSMTSLRDLYFNNCRVRAAMQFYRTPFWTENFMDDLRYIRNDQASFARLDLTSAECPVWLTPWKPPLYKILSPTILFDH